MGKYLDMAKAFEARQAEQTESPPSPSPAWLCPHCGQLATIEAVEPSLDGERQLTFWHCLPCQSYAVTPDTIREPPADADVDVS